MRLIFILTSSFVNAKISSELPVDLCNGFICTNPRFVDGENLPRSLIRASIDGSIDSVCQFRIDSYKHELKRLIASNDKSIKFKYWDNILI